MERDDVREAWASFEAQLRRTERLSDLIVVESLSRRARAPLNRERFFLWVEIGLNALAVVFLGSFAFNHAGSAAGVCATILAAALLAVDAVLTSIAVGLSRVDFENSVLQVQAELAGIKARRAALVAATLTAGPLLWTPLLVVLIAVAGADPVRALGIPYIAANAAFGAFVAGGALLVARFFGERLRTSPRMVAVVDGLSGRSYSEAAEYLDTIERYSVG